MANYIYRAYRILDFENCSTFVDTLSLAVIILLVFVSHPKAPSVSCTEDK